jgi:two-component system response regulator MtrA
MEDVGRRMVLVVEDDPHTVQMVHDVLELDGLTAVGVGDPEQVEGVARSIVPDLFLIDVMLPGRSGIELAAQLRETAFTNTPMIAMSASPLMAEVAAESGLFQAQLEKPFDVDDLLERILECISQANGNEEGIQSQRPPVPMES